MTRTIAYVRVSTDKQADSGLSLDAQSEKIKAYVGLYGLDLVETIVDAGESAKTLDRPGLQTALALLSSGKADALLVVKLDRLTRSVVDLGKLIEAYFNSGKWALLSVGEQIDTRSAAGRLVLNILASVSQWEREAIAERTREVMQHKRAAGEYTGGPAPYGWRADDDGRLILVDQEQAVVCEARRLWQEGGLSLQAIADRLTKGGYRSRNGRRFEPMQIRRMVLSVR